jgi:Kef-type K+ transport system membrane component KefB
MRPTLAALVVITTPAVALAAGPGGESLAALLFYLVVILLAATLGGDLAVRLGQPAVLGELLAGVVIGNLDLAGIVALEPLVRDPHIDMLAQLGVLLLLFEVGLESTVRQMLSVGLTSLAVAVLGVLAPFALGWGVGVMLVPDQGIFVHAFLGATLTATSVGITARVLQDLGRSRSGEARVILGAAVIDDVLGLVILAVVSAVIVAAGSGATLEAGHIALIVVKALSFLVVALIAGVWLSPRLFGVVSRLQRSGVLVMSGLGFCFLLAYLANAIGLAAIVGAFAAGLVLEDVHFKEFTDRGESGLETLLKPLTNFLVPVFFVLMGARTDVRAFGEPGVLSLAAALTLAAIVGKQLCSLGVIGKQLDKLSVGIGMVPRGEVGLIFANVGQSLTLNGAPVVTPTVYSALVVMVIVTTMATPPALKWSLGRGST